MAPVAIGLIAVPVPAQPAEMPNTRSFDRARDLVDAGSYREAIRILREQAADLPVLLPPDSALLQFLNLSPRMLLVWATGAGERGLYFLPDAVDLPAMVEAYRVAVARRAQPEGSRGGSSLTTPTPSAAPS